VEIICGPTDYSVAMLQSMAHFQMNLCTTQVWNIIVKEKENNIEGKN
jgi:hypothetical protein